MRKLLVVALGLVGLATMWWLTPGEIPLADSGPRLSATLEKDWPDTESPAREAAFSPDGALLATSNAAGDVTLRQSPDWHAVRQLRVPGGVTSVAFAPDGTTLFTAGYDGIVRSWNVADSRLTDQLKGANGTIWSLDVRPDGGEVAAAGEDGLIRIWNLKTRAVRIFKGHERNVWEVHYSADGKTLASAGFDKTARLWREGSQPRLLRGHGEAVVGMDLSPDGRLIATGSDDSTLRLWRTDTGKPVRTIDAKNHVYGVEFSSDGRWLLTAGRARGGPGTLWHQLTGLGGKATPVHLWRVSDGAAVAALPHADDVMYATFSPDMRHVVTSGEKGVCLWRLEKR